MSPMLAARATDGEPSRIVSSASSREARKAQRRIGVRTLPPFFREKQLFDRRWRLKGFGCLRSKGDSGAAGELPGFGVDLHLFALLNEERNLDLEACLEAGVLGDVAGSVAARAGLGVDDFQ